MSVIELTTFTVKPDNTSAMLAARPGMVDAFRRDRRGFITAWLIRVAENTWLDSVEWIDDTAWDESRAKGANQPEIAAFFATIDTLVSSERGVRYDDAEDGRRAVRTVAYGPHPSQVGELYLPEGDGPFPVIVLIHGGFWSAIWDRRGLTPFADALVGEGYAVWNIEYRRIGEDGGGWPGTFDDVSAAVDAVAGLDPALDLSRVQVVGHSSGAQLATWVAGRSDSKVPIVAVASLAGALDVVAAEADKLGDGIMPLLFGGHREDVPERYARAVQPLTIPLLQILGDADDRVPLKYAGHPSAEFHEAKNTGHYDVIDPKHSSWSLLRDWLAARIV